MDDFSDGDRERLARADADYHAQVAADANNWLATQLAGAVLVACVLLLAGYLFGLPMW